MNKLLYLFIFVLSCAMLYPQKHAYNSNEYEITLLSAIEEGLKNNPEIKSAQEKINLSDGKFWSGISLPQPQLNFNYDFVPGGKNLNNFTERVIEVSQSFDFPTNYFLKGALHSGETEISRMEFNLTKIEVTGRIKTAYYNLVHAKEQLRIEEENLSLTADFMQKAEIRYNVGEGTNLELLTAKVQYSESLNNVARQKNEVIQANTELNFVLGNDQTGSCIYKPTDNLEYTELNYDETDLINNSFNNNAEIKIGELTVSKSSTENSLAWSGLLPGFNLAYSKQTLEGNDNYYGASFGISVPLWFLFDQRGRIQETSANESIAEYELQLIRNKVRVQIIKAYTRFKNHQKQMQMYKTDLLPLSDEVYSTALKSYEAGEITYLEFLQAKQFLINSKSNYIKTLLDYNLSIVDLETAAGFELNK